MTHPTPQRSTRAVLGFQQHFMDLRLVTFGNT